MSISITHINTSISMSIGITISMTMSMWLLYCCVCHDQIINSFNRWLWYL